MDQIIIRDLSAHGIIGVHPHERHQKQEIRINVSMGFDTRIAGKSDDLRDTINYQTIVEQLLRIVEETSYFLIERLADHIASFILKEYPITEVSITIDKPQALHECQSVAVQMTRKRIETL